MRRIRIRKERIWPFIRRRIQRDYDSEATRFLFGPPFGQPPPSDWHREALALTDNCRRLLAFLVIGEEHPGLAIITGLYVPPDERGKGRAKSLLQAGIERCLELGYSRVQLNVYAPRLARLLSKHLWRYRMVLEVNIRGNDMEALTLQEEESLVEEEPGGTREAVIRAYTGAAGSPLLFLLGSDFPPLLFCLLRRPRASSRNSGLSSPRSRHQAARPALCCSSRAGRLQGWRATSSRNPTLRHPKRPGPPEV